MKQAILFLVVLVGCTQGAGIFAQPRFNETLSPLREAVIITDPGASNIYYREGTRLLELGEFEHAVDAFLKAVELSPTSALIQNDLGYAYFVGGRYGEAIAAYEHAIGLEPNYVIAYNNLGVAYLRLKDFEKARSAFNKAITLKPDYASAYYNLAVAHHVTGDIAKSMKAFKDALRAQPKYAKAMIALACLFID